MVCAAGRCHLTQGGRGRPLQTDHRVERAVFRIKWCQSHVRGQRRRGADAPRRGLLFLRLLCFLGNAARPADSPRPGQRNSPDAPKGERSRSLEEGRRR